MKERADMTSLNDHPLLPPSPLAGHQHQHRLSRKGSGLDDTSRELPTRGAEINLLANSLTTRLRKAARQKAVTSSARTPATDTADSRVSRSAPAVENEDRKERKSSKTSSTKRGSQQPQTRPSILKRTLSKEEADKQHRYLLGQASRSVSPYDDHHLPDVFMDRRLSASTGHLDRVDAEIEGYNNQFLDTPSPAIAFTGVGFGGGGGGGFGGGGSTRMLAANGEVVWVKRSGIFQPADKYASGRQNLHGEDHPYSRSLAVDYETVTLPSRPDSAESDNLSAGWSSGKGSRKKGLKVSWKQPEDQSEAPEDSRQGDSGSSLRQRSAGTVHGEATAFAFCKPKFKPGKSRVPVIGVKWKVQTPTMGKGQMNGHARDAAGSPCSRHSSGHSSPASISSAPSSLASSVHRGATPAKPMSHTRDIRHPWRALLPRDVHPVTTAMEREGTSVSKTKWHVPGLRRVPEYTFIEDLMESRCHQWHPAVQRPRHPTRATFDAQSLQARLREGEPNSGATTTTSTTASNTISNDTDFEIEFIKRS